MRYSDKLGFTVITETSPGVHEEKIIEHHATGDVIRMGRGLRTSSEANDGISTSNSISIVADPFIYENMYNLRYAKLHGVKWKVVDVSVARPRLTLSLGGVYIETTN